MISIKSNSDKRAIICAIDYCFISECTFVDYPGDKCKCIGTFLSVKFSTAEFTQEDPVNGSGINQELSIVIRGQNKDVDKINSEICGKYLVLKITYSNGDVIIVGNKDNPVILTYSKTGNPIFTTLKSSRISAEKAKYIIP